MEIPAQLPVAVDEEFLARHQTVDGKGLIKVFQAVIFLRRRRWRAKNEHESMPKSLP
jgi:hypothetical protein